MDFTGIPFGACIQGRRENLQGGSRKCLFARKERSVRVRAGRGGGFAGCKGALCVGRPGEYAEGELLTLASGQSKRSSVAPWSAAGQQLDSCPLRPHYPILMCMTICRPSPALCPCWLQSSKAHFSALHAQQLCFTLPCKVPLRVRQPLLALQH